MLFFFATVTVFVPAIILAGIIALAAHDAIERSALEQPTPRALGAKFQVPGTEVTDRS
jgi:MFS superfamily sulfate permease-like transporter